MCNCDGGCTTHDCERDYIEFSGEITSRPKPTKKTWVTREGQHIMVEDMSDSHHVNTIRMLRRVAPLRLLVKIIDAYGFLGCVNGEMAGDAVEGSIRSLENMTPEDFLTNDVPTWPALLEEAEKRGLKP